MAHAYQFNFFQFGRQAMLKVETRVTSGFREGLSPLYSIRTAARVLVPDVSVNVVVDGPLGNAVKALQERLDVSLKLSSDDEDLFGRLRHDETPSRTNEHAFLEHDPVIRVLRPDHRLPIGPVQHDPAVLPFAVNAREEQRNKVVVCEVQKVCRAAEMLNLSENVIGVFQGSVVSCILNDFLLYPLNIECLILAVWAFSVQAGRHDGVAFRFAPV